MVADDGGVLGLTAPMVPYRCTPFLLIPPPTYQQQQQQFSVAPPPPHTHLQEMTRNHCVHGGDAVPATVSRAERASSVLPVSRLLRTSAAGHLFPIARPFRPPPPRRRRRHPTAPRPSCAAPQLGRWAANSKDLRWDGGGTNLIANSPMISEPILVNKNQVGANVELKKEAFTSLNSDENVILPRDPERQGTTVSNVSDDPERAMEEQAAIKAQAAFRGCLARRAFRALKGIIKLQALIRGHLVRRQAVATLHCMWAIVRIQALIHGRRVSRDKGFQDAKHADPAGRNLSSWKGKASTNALVRKLLSSPTIAKPLKIHYHLESSNSAWSWLERWTTSKFWKPPPQKKKAVDSKPPHRHYTMETESGRPKRSVRRNFGANTESGSNGMMASEPEKLRRNTRKVSSHPAEHVVLVDNPQSELEKVKRSLRKVSSSMGESSDRVEVETDKAKPKIYSSNGESSDQVEVESEKSKLTLPKVSNSTPNVLVQSADASAEEVNKYAVNLVPDSIQNVEISSNLSLLNTKVPSTEIPGDEDSAENVKEDVKMTPDIPQNMEAIHIPMAIDEPADVDDHTSVVSHPPENSEGEESTPVGDKELNLEEQASHENHKSSKRRASFLTKSEYTENGLQSSPMLPSYMAATESAKAKARGQNSPRLSSEGVDRSAFTRRHSLPSLTNGKLASLSPRTQKLAPTSCKGGIRSERPLLSSRDGNEKPIHVDWRR